MNNSQPARALKALHVFGTLNRGGAETWFMDVVRRADRDRLALDVCLIGTGTGAYEAEFEAHGGHVFRCPITPRRWRFSRSLYGLLMSESYDIVHSHVYFFSGVVLRSACRAGVPQRIAHLHPAEDVKEKRLLRSLYVRWMRRWIARYATHLVAPTKASLQSFCGPDWRSDKRARVIYNGIDVRRFSGSENAPEVRRGLSIPVDAKMVLNVARFAPHKRHSFLVDVAQRLLLRRDDVFFVLIGAGNLRGEIMRKVSDLGLDGCFRFIAGEPDIDRYWLTADAFAFPSRNEGFGIVVAEAAAAGLPVVAQDISGVREAAEICHDVALLPLDTDADQWSRSLEAALDRGRLDEDARRRRLSRFPFTIEASLASLEELYGISEASRMPLT